MLHSTPRFHPRPSLLSSHQNQRFWSSNVFPFNSGQPYLRHRSTPGEYEPTNLTLKHPCSNHYPLVCIERRFRSVTREEKEEQNAKLPKMKRQIYWIKTKVKTELNCQSSSQSRKKLSRIYSPCWENRTRTHTGRMSGTVGLL